MCFALYTVNGGNLLPDADPQPENYVNYMGLVYKLGLPKTVIYSRPEPPPTSYTAFDPFFARTCLDAEPCFITIPQPLCNCLAFKLIKF